MTMAATPVPITKTTMTAAAAIAAATMTTIPAMEKTTKVCSPFPQKIRLNGGFFDSHKESRL